RLGHEVDTAEHNGIGLYLRGGPSQLQTIAGEVGQFLNLALLVVVSQDGSVVAALEGGGFLEEISHGRSPCFLCGAGATHIQRFRDGLASSASLYTSPGYKTQWLDVFSHPFRVKRQSEVDLPLWVRRARIGKFLRENGCRTGPERQTGTCEVLYVENLAC